MVISSLKKQIDNSILVGKPEADSTLHYHIPNSPTRVSGLNLCDQVILHRTQAGARGVLDVIDSQGIIFVASFVNAAATVKKINELQIKHVVIMPMGHEAVTPSLEDNLCAEYIKSLMLGYPWDLGSFKKALRDGPGQYFFNDDQWQYPQQDYDRCLAMDTFDFAVIARGNRRYCELQRCDTAIVKS